MHFDTTVTGYERHADGTVTARFADGGSATGDVLVGADGGSSKIRAQYLPSAGRVDTGIVGIAGKYLLTEASRGRLDPMLLRTPITVMPPKDHGMFCAPHELTPPLSNGPTDLLAAGIGGNDAPDPGTNLDNTRSYVFWAFAGRRDAYDPSLGKLEALDGARLRQIVLDKIASWSPALRFLVAESDVDTVAAIPILTSTPVPAWPTTNVTLLGDAIHSMTPFRGIGANTALRDAQLLSSQLIAADRGERPLLEAINAYETGMLDYGFAAVRTSMRAAQQFVAPSRAGRIVTNAVFRTFSAIPPLKRMAFADRTRR